MCQPTKEEKPVKMKTITVSWKVTEARYYELLAAAKAWHYKSLPSYIKGTVEQKLGKIQP
jgi:hypothetical protein